ncbi:hypothetical protein MiTe_00630 [Microcystis aeruginosa NIES-2520]|jgi:sugar lactone lactonase YvrE|uniref:SMP-30/Gluconolactonase/LRE-like region domain-containing protein n=1 Tax=Microcystis aeruginosa NIES-2520 TaxID=2303982 RepID=A0A5A5RCM8_MICAE|nr:SMP-30/gluconolactonase/LRE family protein [Microcystis aeruginosa]MDJ0527223.1 SMP-30/gluconolactonase/LRE family protein [Microcystis sp. M53600_WE12]GCA73810.1 hypothetical protein MiTe_00630 [Microcystis aeruginosa NIES-2520]
MKFANLPFLSKLSVVSATVILAAGPVRGAPLDAVRWADVPLGQPGQPDGLTADAKGNIYAASFTLTSNFQPPFNNNIYVWNPNGQLLSTTPLPSQAVPLGNVAVGNTFYQLDVWNGDVLEYNLPLTNLSTPTHTYHICGGFASLFSGQGKFCGLNAIEIISDGKLLISDNGASNFGQNQGNIYYLDRANSTSGIFFSNSALDPLGFPPFGVNGLAFNHDKSALFLANMSTDTIYKLDLTGCAVSCLPGNLSIFAQGGPIDGPDNIDFDDNGLLWVSSGQKDQVVALNAQGSVVQVVGSFGGLSSDGAPIGLLQPSGIVFSQGNIYVGNESNPTLRPLNDPINIWESTSVRGTKYLHDCTDLGCINCGT